MKQYKIIKFFVEEYIVETFIAAREIFI